MPGPSTGLTRVTISSPQRRVDVALPDGVPLAELLPELLEHAGEAMADNGERHGGWALRRADGTALSPGAALTTQGVRDGAVLHLVPARAEWPELEYDDVVEAIAAGARRYGVGWSGRASRVTALAVAGVALAAGLWAVLRSGPEWTVPALAALGVAAVLLLAGVVSSRAYGDVVAGAALCAYAMPYGFVGGLVLLAGSAPLSQVKAWHLLDGAVALLVTALLGAVGAAYALRLFVAGATAAVLGVFAGRLLVGVAAAAFLLRARLFVTVRHRVPLLAAGAGSYGLLAVALLGGHPSNANLALVAGLVLAALLVAATGARYAGRAPSPYLGRAADLLDAICVVSVVPIACAVLNLFRLATGLIPT